MKPRACAIAVALVCLACATPQPPAPAAPALVPLVATDEIRGEFLMRQQLRFRWQQQEGQADAVVQMVCGELTVLLLTPFGTPAVVIRQRGRDVTIESKLPGPFSFPPEYILLDVQRTYFVPIGEPPLTAGRRVLEWHGESIEEVWANDALVERTFTSERDGAQQRVVIGYPGGITRDAPPQRTTLDDLHRGYHLEVSTLSRVALSCPE